MQQLAMNLKVNNLQFNDIKEFEIYKFPQTRYQGSKAKLTDFIWENIKNIEFETALDLFGGTGCVSHLLKTKGKSVYYNDILKFNYTIGKALIENNHEKINEDDLKVILDFQDDNYPTFIFDNFKNIFYTDDENLWLDRVIFNINKLENDYKKALAFFALFQACIIKRPYNLFHRANLYVRQQEVQRSFGNKVTWDTPFEEHFLKFIKEANNAVFDNQKHCESLNFDAMELPIENLNVDLIYIDTPYISSKGVGTDYLDFYHFLEGMLDYENWESKILLKYKHKPLFGRGSNPWTKKNEIYESFDKLFERYADYKLVISYRDNGIPSIDEIMNLLQKYKKNIAICSSTDYKYALAKEKNKEVLIIAE